jgi:hypothetical protein
MLSAARPTLQEFDAAGSFSLQTRTKAFGTSIMFTAASARPLSEHQIEMAPEKVEADGPPPQLFGEFHGESM